MDLRWLGIGFLLLCVSVDLFALGMGPSRVEYYFRPGLSGTFTVHIKENAGEEMEIVMYAEGDLAEYVTDISPNNFTLHASEVKDVTYTFKLPETLPKFGRNDTLIIAKTAATSARQRGSQFAAIVAIGHQFWVHVPYPYLYAESTLTTENVELEVIRNRQPVFFDVRLTNLGSEDLNATRLTFSIRSPSGEVLSDFPERINDLAKGVPKVEEYDWIAS
ncbi:MAG: hypothetical protein Q7R47_03965, partial [Candidatus Diapherotrites archaeon]|nr:hypothetical protein [Candidatus Diapherotrites archaeon]